MRWGVPEQAAENHSTTDLCIQEINKCKQVSVGPCFVVSNPYVSVHVEPCSLLADLKNEAN